MNKHGYLNDRNGKRYEGPIVVIVGNILLNLHVGPIVKLLKAPTSMPDDYQILQWSIHSCWLQMWRTCNISWINWTRAQIPTSTNTIRRQQFFYFHSVWYGEDIIMWFLIFFSIYFILCDIVSMFFQWKVLFLTYVVSLCIQLTSYIEIGNFLENW